MNIRGQLFTMSCSTTNRCSQPIIFFSILLYFTLSCSEIVKIHPFGFFSYDEQFCKLFSILSMYLLRRHIYILLQIKTYATLSERLHMMYEQRETVL
jgi:hypothetical protein